MNRIDKKFKQLKKENKKAFIPFLTAGYPDLSATERLVLAFEKNGADIIELGVPFSDPVADGPVIQMSSHEALRKGVTLTKILASVARLRHVTQIPLAAMSYFNPILQYGLSRFIKDALKAGLDAVIIPDLPIEEETEFAKEAVNKGLYLIRFITPTTAPARARLIARQSKGFIYFVSLTGVTGTRQSLPPELKSQLVHVKKITGSIPVCAGFGVSTRQQVRFVSSLCDGVIVGSAIVKRISEHVNDPRLASRAGTFIRGLRT